MSTDPSLHGTRRDPRPTWRRCGPATCRPTAGARWPTSTTRAWPPPTRSVARRSPRSRRRTASTPRPSRRCSPWRTTSSASPAGSSTRQTGFAGVVTSGGTESILLAVLAARDARPEITAPRMVLPTTAHAAFHKAAHWLGVEPVFVDVDPVTKRADPEAMAAAIDERTVLVVASAPSYAHGVIDPVEPIAAAAAAAGRPVPRRRLHRRLGAPPPARHRARPAAVDLRRRRRHEPVARPAQVRLHPEGRLDPAARLGRPAPHAPLRLGPLARLHDAQHDGAVDEVRRPARRGLGRRPPHRRRPLPSTWPARRATATLALAACGGRHTRPVACGTAGLDAALPDHRRARATSSRSATRCSTGAGSSSRRCASATCRPRCTSPSAQRRRRRPTSSRPTSPTRRRRPAAAGPATPPAELVAMASAIDPATLDEATFAGLLAAAGLAGGDGGARAARADGPGQRPARRPAAGPARGAAARRRRPARPPHVLTRREAATPRGGRLSSRRWSVRRGG